MGHFLGSNDKEQRGLEFCFPPRMLILAVLPCSPRADSKLLLTPHCHSSSSVQQPSCRVCREGLPSALPTGCFPNPCHSTHKHIHTCSASLTHGATRTCKHIPSFSLFQLLTSTSPWNLSGKMLLIQQGRIVLISLFVALAF